MMKFEQLNSYIYVADNASRLVDIEAAVKPSGKFEIPYKGLDQKSDWTATVEITSRPSKANIAVQPVDGSGSGAYFSYDEVGLEGVTTMATLGKSTREAIIAKYGQGEREGKYVLRTDKGTVLMGLSHMDGDTYQITFERPKEEGRQITDALNSIVNYSIEIMPGSG